MTLHCETEPDFEVPHKECYTCSAKGSREGYEEARKRFSKETSFPEGVLSVAVAIVLVISAAGFWECVFWGVIHIP